MFDLVGESYTWPVGHDHHQGAIQRRRTNPSAAVCSTTSADKRSVGLRPTSATSGRQRQQERATRSTYEDGGHTNFNTRMPTTLTARGAGSHAQARDRYRGDGGPTCFEGDAIRFVRYGTRRDHARGRPAAAVAP